MLSEGRVKYYTELPSQPFETGKSVFMYEVRQMAAELLSLREQLAELKAFISNECFIIDPEDDENCIRAEYHTKYGELFTAAKPAGESNEPM
ncbi:hypothetical protein [Yersinia enterocolitica]|uniref:hypothetical protein n=1 Tax=Yersinia enterocolitica TaxID=630 RepID=UPI001C609F54|nr:hypothetical protein [Yersinia enterocolitica]MBW5852989.1 hypothetical protein [Yersinia enterocolitica]